ncbi:hypothetical protein [Paraburkholderia nodosa]|uniref:hypothetical protein n=1 Tax=Paraburkholderia nodosa TaxID=392320 RepID=UPI000841D918|nr:hypothetical protein [Paraburkholderia nodosa]
MSGTNLFDSTEDLRAAMLRLECGCDVTARELIDRIQAQQRALPDLLRFGRGVDVRQYVAAHEMVVAVAANSMKADRLEVLLLRLECEFVKRKARANRSLSNARFAPFWNAFDAIVTGRRCRGATDAHQKAASAAPPPHPMPSVSRKRYGKIRREMGIC